VAEEVAVPVTPRTLATINTDEELLPRDRAACHVLHAIAEASEHLITAGITARIGWDTVLVRPAGALPLWDLGGHRFATSNAVGVVGIAGIVAVPLAVPSNALLGAGFARVDVVVTGSGRLVPDAPPEALGAFLRRQPDYFAISSKTCDDTFAWLRSVGLDETQAARVLREEPAILTMPIEQLQLRASFFVRVIGGSPAELVAVPHMLICDLGKVPMLRHAYCLTQGIDVKPIQLLVKGDATFCTEVAGCDIEEFNAFEADGKHLAFFQGAGI
jgi:hypothetical protein